MSDRDRPVPGRRARLICPCKDTLSVPKNNSDEHTISMAVRRVMQRKARIESQKELAELVLKELRKDNPEVRVGAARIRRIAVTSGAARLEIDYRETDRKDLPDICPVCGSGMSSIMNNTLDGELTEIKRNCSVCPFTVGKTVLVPGRYCFVRSTGEVNAEELRIRKLKKAASLLRQASRLIDDAVENTNFPERGEYAREMIDEIVNSREMTGSIPNLISDVRSEGHRDPLWTEPLSTPKYPDRKGI